MDHGASTQRLRHPGFAPNSVNCTQSSDAGDPSAQERNTISLAVLLRALHTSHSQVLQPLLS
jgi:hypothetical protein